MILRKEMNMNSLSAMTFAIVAIIGAAEASAQSSPPVALPFDPTNTRIVFQEEVQKGSHSQWENVRSNQTSKIKCLASVDNAVANLESRIRDLQMEWNVKKRDPNLDLESNCKTIVFWGVPAKTFETYVPYSVSGIFLRGTRYMVETETTGGRVFAGCEQRNLAERVLSVSVRNCFGQWTDSCFKLLESESARALVPLRFLRLVDPEVICGLSSSSPSQSSNSQFDPSRVREMP